MSQFLSDIGAYLRAVFFDGVQKTFTLFDILGLVIYFLPKLGESLSQDMSLATNIGEGIILVSFLLANFSLYRSLAKRSLLGFDIIAVQSVGISGDLLIFNQKLASIADTFIVDLQALVNISNSGPTTSVRVFISAVEPDCIKQDVSISDIEVSLQYKIAPNHPVTPVENPYYLKADEMSKIQLRAKIPFSTDCVEKKLGALALFKEMKVTLGIQRTGDKPFYRSIRCDLTPNHKHFKEQFGSKFQHLQSTGLSGPQVLEVYDRYMGVHH